VNNVLQEAWTIAIETLSWIEMQRLNDAAAFARTAKQLSIDDPDALRLARRLAVETVRRKNFIDAIIRVGLENQSIENLDLGLQSFLRLYVYEMKFARNGEKPDLAAATGIVKLGRSILGWKEFRNIEPYLGFLLTINPETVLKGASDENRIGLLTFHPAWFVRYSYRLLDRAEAIRLLEGDIEPSLTYVRLNTLKAGESVTVERAAQDGIRLAKVNGLRYLYRVLGGKGSLVRTGSFKDGLFEIQDKASCLVAEVADPKAGMVVIDVCGAPGSLTTYLAQLMRNEGSIYSLDRSKLGMRLWQRETKRLGVEIGMPIICDVREPFPLDASANVVVLDPPCTQTGMFRKVPSGKWRVTQKSIDRMAGLQWQMLANCAEHVKPQGTLVYTTSSITVEENELIVERFLKWHPEFALAEATPKIGLSGLRGLSRCQRLYPHVHNCDGAFIAKMVKTVA
jgi:16S rRNA (cytosine967-C5)-methyltransferase